MQIVGYINTNKYYLHDLKMKFENIVVSDCTCNTQNSLLLHVTPFFSFGSFRGRSVFDLGGSGYCLYLVFLCVCRLPPSVFWVGAYL